MAIDRRPNTPDTYARDAHNLGKYLGINPRNLDTKKLAQDIWYATKQPEHHTLGQATRKLDGMIRRVLPAYRTTEAVGPALPIHDDDFDDVEDYLPRVKRGDQVEQHFRWHNWVDYVHGLAAWIATNTGQEPGTYDVEQAAADLAIVYAAMDISGKTPRYLAGLLGMAEFAQLLTDNYGPDGTGKWYLVDAPDDADQDDQDNQGADQGDYYSDVNEDWAEVTHGVADLREDIAQAAAAIIAQRDAERDAAHRAREEKQTAWNPAFAGWNWRPEHHR